MSKSKPPRPPVEPTEGEWGLRESHGQIELVATEGDVKHLVATLTCSHVARPQGKCNLRGKDEVEANARLLLVAREMFALLKQAVSLIQETGYAYTDDRNRAVSILPIAESLIAAVETPVDIPAGRSLAPCVELGIGKE